MGIFEQRMRQAAIRQAAIRRVIPTQWVSKRAIPFGLFFAVQTLLIVFKLAHVIETSWVIVLTPVFLFVLSFIFSLTYIFVVAVLYARNVGDE